MVSIKLFMPQRKKNQIVRNMMINIFPHNFKYYVSHYENKITKKIMKIWRDVWNKKLSLISSRLSFLWFSIEWEPSVGILLCVYLIWLYSTKPSLMSDVHLNAWDMHVSLLNSYSVMSLKCHQLQTITWYTDNFQIISSN